MIRTDPPFTQPSAALIRPRIQTAALGLGSDPIAGAALLRFQGGARDLVSMRNNADAANISVLVNPGSDFLTVGGPGSGGGLVRPGIITVDATGATDLATGGSVRIRCLGAAIRFETTPLNINAGVTPVWSHDQSAAGAGRAWTLIAQAAAAASGADGGPFDVAGGAGDGVGVDGPVQLSTAIAWPYAGNNIEALGAAKTLTVGDPHFQLLDPNGADRNVDTTADAEAIDTWFVVFNSGAANVLNLRDSAATALVALAVGEAAIIVRDSTAGAWGVIGPL